MHMAGHVDKWCKENCDARKFTDLDNVSVHVITHASFPYVQMLHAEKLERPC